MIDFQLELDILFKKLNDVERKNDGVLDQASRSITLCRNVLCSFKKEIFINGFISLKQEIDFFKNTKQTPLTPLIYYSEIHSFELQYPKADKKTQLKFIRNKIRKLNRFFTYNLDFGQYVDSGASHFDKEYYTRDYLDEFHIGTSKFYFQDPDFCTPRDMLLGKFKANKSLIGYMDKLLFQQKNDSYVKNTTLPSLEKIPWPFTNADWVELVYALHAAGIKKKNKISIIELSQRLQQVFDHEPSQKIYKVYQNIKNRNQRTSFLDFISTSLISEMNKSEE